MREVSDNRLKAQLTVDDSERVRQINYLEEPWKSSQESPLLAAIEFLRQMSGVLGLAEDELRAPQQKVSFMEPREQGVEYRLGAQKELFDASTFIFNQTYLNAPVWRAAITLTVKHNPNRVVTATDTSERGINARLPSPDKIEQHRKLFVLAAAEQKLRVLGLETASPAESAGQPATAFFVRRVLGRDADENAPEDDAQAIRGRFFVYCYDESKRLPKQMSAGVAPETMKETPGDNVEAETYIMPTLSLPPVDPSVKDGEWRLVSEVTFSLSTPEYGALNWRALIDVQTDSVLLLEPLVSGDVGMVFARDPITSTGNPANGPNRDNNVLNPFRVSLDLPNLDAPVNGVQSLRGRFAVVTNIELPSVVPPTTPANSRFDYDVRTDEFAAVNAYYHTDRFFALVESLGFPITTFFNNTSFPVPIDHRGLGNSINAHCVGNGAGGIGHACYGLNDNNTADGPIGRACDSRVHLHELGGHGILYEHVGTANFGFAHSAGDSLSAILHDPDSMLRNHPQLRFRYAPWNPENDREFNRAVSAGWAWGGPKYGPFTLVDRFGYQAEQILSTTLFRLYRSIGGDSADLTQRRFASRVTMYLILRAISTLTPATNPTDPISFANALMAVDLLNWTSEGVFGGAYNKVIRWSFEKQGLYQAQGAPTPVMREGEPPDVDVFIDDGRGGEYQYTAQYWNNPSVWNRRAADGVGAHQEPGAGVTNYAYVRIKNRGTRTAQNVRVRGFHHRPGGGTVWPEDFLPLTTQELLAGTLAARGTEEKVVGPFAWVPNADALGHDSLLMVVSADGDASNVDHFTTGEAVPEWRLVPNDNNLGLRSVFPVPAESEQPPDGAAESPAARGARPASSEQLLQLLGLVQQLPKNVRIKNLTFQVEVGDLASPAEEEAASVSDVEGLFESDEAAGQASWGMRRHAAIATAAMERLQSQRARDEITRILDEGGDGSLGEAARWADRLRSSDRPRDPATERFLASNRGFSAWHYVNLPLGLDGYDRERYPEFTRRDDVVQIILRCVEALRSPGPRARFEEIIALRWLTHLAGDVHQPVHVGCGFIANAATSQARLVVDPDEVVGLPSDLGGNELRLPIGTSLHKFWDSQLGPDFVPDPINAESDEPLVRALVAAPAPAPAEDETDVEGRVIGWANASLEAAREAYRSLRIVGFSPSDEGDYPVDWEGEAAYRQRCSPIVSARMGAAASNLAALLDTIWR